VAEQQHAGPWHVGIPGRDPGRRPARNAGRADPQPPRMLGS
jgi:hypothetical protein